MGVGEPVRYFKFRWNLKKRRQSGDYPVTHISRQLGYRYHKNLGTGENKKSECRSLSWKTRSPLLWWESDVGTPSFPLLGGVEGEKSSSVGVRYLKRPGYHFSVRRRWLPRFDFDENWWNGRGLISYGLSSRIVPFSPKDICTTPRT